ncbi:MAG TPA: hypothetical protein VGE93_09175, partial [Bryobacteraceae bacterium]
MTASVSEVWSRPSGRQLVAFGTPILVSSSATIIGNLIDIAFLGNFQTADLAVSAAGNAIMDIPINVVLGAILA